MHYDVVKVSEISIIFLIIFVIGFSFNFETAFGCSCSGYNLESALNGSDYVFLGTVEKIESDTGVNLKVGISPIKFWKGIESEKITVFTGRDEGVCGFPFAKNQTYLVFAHENEDGIISSGLCSLTQNEVDASEEIFLLDNNLAFLSTLWVWLMVPVYWAMSIGGFFLFTVLLVGIGLSIYFFILYKKEKLFPRKS